MMLFNTKVLAALFVFASAAPTLAEDGNLRRNTQEDVGPNPNRFIIKGTNGKEAKDKELEQDAIENNGNVKMRIGKGNQSLTVVELPPNANPNAFKNKMKAKGFEVEEDVPRYPVPTMEEEWEYGIDPETRKLADETPWGISKVFRDSIPGPDDLPTEMIHPMCIIDSGYAINHPDLPNDARNADSRQGSNSGNPFSIDRCKHGTHVAGTIAAIDNEQGVIGVFPGAPQMRIVKVFGNTSSTSCLWTYTSSLIQAAQYCVESGASIISMSLGGGGSNFEGSRFQNFVDNNNMLIIAAAGNGGNTAKSYPASYPSVVSVGATDQSDNIASFSQKNNEVDISAPGVSVKSTTGTSGYSTYSGTSMSTPHVSGVALLLWNQYPACNNKEIRTALEQSAEDKGTSGRDDSYGWGIVNYHAAVTYLTANNACAAAGPVSPSANPVTASPVTGAPSKSPVTTPPVTGAPSKSPVTTPPVTGAPTKSPTVGVSCSSITWKRECRRAAGCSWSRGQCVA